MVMSVPQLLIILAIVLVLFGAKKLRNIGADLGGAIKNFKHSMRDGEKNANADAQPEETPVTTATDAGRVIEAEVVKNTNEGTVKTSERV